MLNLLRKDVIAIKSSFWIIFVYLAVFSFAFIPNNEMSIYFVSIYTAFGIIILATTVDIKNNNHRFLVTLPINRKQIVLGKYITSILLAVFGILASYGVHEIAKLAAPELVKPYDPILSIVIPVGIVLVLTSIYMPLFYALSKKGAGVINVVFMIVLIVFAQPVGYLIHAFNNQQSISKLVLFLIPAAIVIFVVASYYLTIYLFKKKDL